MKNPRLNWYIFSGIIISLGSLFYSILTSGSLSEMIFIPLQGFYSTGIYTVLFFWIPIYLPLIFFLCFATYQLNKLYLNKFNKNLTKEFNNKILMMLAILFVWCAITLYALSFLVDTDGWMLIINFIILGVVIVAELILYGLTRITVKISKIIYTSPKLKKISLWLPNVLKTIFGIAIILFFIFSYFYIIDIVGCGEIYDGLAQKSQDCNRQRAYERLPPECEEYNLGDNGAIEVDLCYERTAHFTKNKELCNKIKLPEVYERCINR
ncbi:MAG: hypothetical protein Q8Q42_03710 [Nanoarchaeota archaeon]|nr:hypothetical protein [Nanoarchaeota archaeon]